MKKEITKLDWKVLQLHQVDERASWRRAPRVNLNPNIKTNIIFILFYYSYSLDHIDQIELLRK